MQSITEDACLFLDVTRIMKEESTYLSRFSHRGPPGCSLYKGVCKNRSNKRWRAVIYYKGHQYFLGSFSDEILAARRYDEASRMMFGDKGYLNFP